MTFEFFGKDADEVYRLGENIPLLFTYKWRIRHCDHNEDTFTYLDFRKLLVRTMNVFDNLGQKGCLPLNAKIERDIETCTLNFNRLPGAGKTFLLQDIIDNTIDSKYDIYKPNDVRLVYSGETGNRYAINAINDWIFLSCTIPEMPKVIGDFNFHINDLSHCSEFYKLDDDGNTAIGKAVHRGPCHE